MATKNSGKQPEGAGDAKGAAQEGVGRPELLEAVRAGLEDVLPGLEIVDRELVLDGGVRADLAGVDSSGALVLVLVAAEDGERAVLAALDTLAFAREHRGLLARHLESRSLNPELEPRTVVVLPANDERLVARLALLLGTGIELFGVRGVESARGARSYLVPLAGPGGGSVERGFPEDGFVAALPPELRDTGRVLVERMARLDEDLALQASRAALVWSFRGEVLARAERIGDRLQASVAPHHEPRGLGLPADVDPFVERALARLVQRLGPEVAPAPLPSPGPSPGNGPPGGARPAEDRGLEVLTPEELQAFRD